MLRQELDEKAIFGVAVKIDDPTARAQYLVQACGNDDALRDRVAVLLRMQEEDPEFLEGQDHPVAATLLNPESTPLHRVGSQIGPYKIREKLAEGGMGAVYVAEQSKPVRRKVALKVIRPGMAGPNVVARFEAERQALAMMDHPNIARVLDGGSTEDELPYFVMELVQGLPITEYCDQKRLTTRERLRLVVDVCRAVQHAHQKGIIHRDLKPTNILVAEIDGKSVPKVIDFGVAKALHQKLTDQTVYTQFSQMVGTPLYMSPEQAAMGVIDVDTRSDVYSLGVVLYELLTGETPFDRERLKSATFDEMRRIIREEEPQRPSAMVSTLKAEAQATIAERRGIDVRKLSDSLSGELDWLVMRALEKDRGRRYESASDLAVDVERYLNDEPVLACPPSIGYRFNKFARRNRDRLIVGTLVGSAIMLAAGFAANAKLTQSRENSQRVADVQSSIDTARVSLDSGDLAAAERWIALARGRLGDADHAELETKVDQVEVELKTHQQERERFELFQELARSVLIIDSQKTLQDRSEDLHELFKALNLYSILDDDEWYQQLQHSYLSAQEQEEVKEAAYQMLLVWADNNVRWRTRGRNAKSATKSLDFLRRAELFHEPTRAFYFVRSECYNYLGEEEKKERDLKAYKEAEAVSAFDHFLPAHTAGWRGRKQEAVEGYKAALLVEPNHYASLFYLAHRQIHTEPRAAAEIFRACLALRPNHSSALINRASCLGRLQEYEEALLLMEKVHENYRESWFFGNRGDIYLDAHRNKEALADFTKGAAIESKKDYPDVELLAKFHRHRARAFERLGERDKCVAAINSAISVLSDDSSSEELVRCYSMRAKLHALAGERDRAFVDAARAQQLIQALGSDVSNKCVAYSHNALAWGLVNSSDLSLRNHPRALEEAELTVAALPTISAGWNTLGVAQYRAGDFTAAIASLEKSSELNDQKDVQDLCLDYIFIAMAHHRLNNDKEALEYYDRALAIREKHGSDSKLDRFFQEAEQLFESETGPANKSSTIDK